MKEGSKVDYLSIVRRDVSYEFNNALTVVDLITQMLDDLEIRLTAKEKQEAKEIRQNAVPRVINSLANIFETS